MRRMLRLLPIGLAVSLTCASSEAQTPTPAGDAPNASYTRIYCTPDNETHFDTVAVNFTPIAAAPPAPPFYRGTATTASRAVILAFGARWGADDLAARRWHPAPVANTVVLIRGTFSITTTDGETRRFSAGDLIRVEDTAPCKGHVTVVGEEPAMVLLVQ